MLNQPCISGINFTCSWYNCLMCFKNQLAKILLRIFASYVHGRYWSEFFLYFNAFICFGIRTIHHHRMNWECSPFLSSNFCCNVGLCLGMQWGYLHVVLILKVFFPAQLSVLYAELTHTNIGPFWGALLSAHSELRDLFQLTGPSLLTLWGSILNLNTLGFSDIIEGIPAEISKALSQHSFLSPVLCPTNSSCLRLFGCQHIASMEAVPQALLGIPSPHCSLNRALGWKLEWPWDALFCFPFLKNHSQELPTVQCWKTVVS